MSVYSRIIQKLSDSGCLCKDFNEKFEEELREQEEDYEEG